MMSKSSITILRVVSVSMALVGGAVLACTTHYYASHKFRTAEELHGWYVTNLSALIVFACGVVGIIAVRTWARQTRSKSNRDDHI